MASAGNGGNYTSKLMQRIDGELVCGICLELFKSPVMLTCGHNFCKDCVYGIIENGMSFSFISLGPPRSFNCPLCQAEMNIHKVTNEGLVINKALESIVTLYKDSSQVDIFDSAWNTDINVMAGTCKKHEKPEDRFCDSCNVAICAQCETRDHQSVKAKHRVSSLKSTALSYQVEVADVLTDLKKRMIPLNDRIQQLENIHAGIQSNQDHITKKLDQQMSSLMSLIRQQQEELKRTLENEMQAKQRPVEAELQECRGIKTNVQELMKKLSEIRKTKNPTLQLKLMKDACKQLTTVLHFDIAMCLQNPFVEETNISSWDLDSQPVINAISGLNWIHDSPECKDMGVQTDNELTDQALNDNKLDLEVPKPMHSPPRGDNLHKHNKNSVERKSNSSPASISHDLFSRSHEHRRSEQGSFDEIDGEFTLVSRERNVKPLEVSETIRDIEQVKMKHHEDVRKVNLTADTMQTNARDKGSNDLDEKFKNLELTDRKRTNGRTSLPMDSTPQRNNEIENRKTFATKTKKSHSDIDLNKGKSGHSFSPSTSEALASFVARRRTMSPSVSSPSLKTLEGAQSGEKDQEESELPTRKTASSLALKSLSKTFSETDYKQDQGLDRPVPSLKPVSGKKLVVEKEEENNSDSKGTAAQTNSTNRKVTEALPVDTLETKLDTLENKLEADRENVTEITITKPDKVPADEMPISRHPKPFSKQPIGMNLDLLFGHHETDTLTTNEPKRVTEV